MLDELEEEMEMSKEQIIELFSTIEENPFMMRKIKEFLSNKMFIQYIDNFKIMSFNTGAQDRKNLLYSHSRMII